MLGLKRMHNLQTLIQPSPKPGPKSESIHHDYTSKPMVHNLMVCSKTLSDGILCPKLVQLKITDKV